MAYKFSKAGNPMAIAEQEYGIDKEIKFTKFTSCIGVIAKRNDTLYAVHLVMVGKEDDPFNETAAVDVVGLFPKLPEKVTIVGCIDDWKNNVGKAYLKLISAIKSLEKYETLGKNDGTYGAKIVGDKIVVTHSH